MILLVSRDVELVDSMLIDVDSNFGLGKRQDINAESLVKSREVGLYLKSQECIKEE